MLVSDRPVERWRLDPLEEYIEIFAHKGDVVAFGDLLVHPFSLLSEVSGDAEMFLLLSCGEEYWNRKAESCDVSCVQVIEDAPSHRLHDLQHASKIHVGAFSERVLVSSVIGEIRRQDVPRFQTLNAIAKICLDKAVSGT